MSKGLPRALRRASPGGGLRPLLTANLTLYVATTGSDTSGDGSANRPFLTPQRAVDEFLLYDLNGFSGTIQLADGTYTSGVVLSRPTVGGLVTLRGDPAAPADVLLDVTNVNGVLVSGFGCRLDVSGVKLEADAGSGLSAQFGGTIGFSDIDFGACTGLAQIGSEFGSMVLANGNYAISAGGSIHKHSSYGALIRTVGRTVTISNTPAFSTQYASASAGGQIQAGTMTFSGTGATGKRYNVVQNGFIGVAGAATTYFPGDVAGTAATGGEYN